MSVAWTPEPTREIDEANYEHRRGNLDAAEAGYLKHLRENGENTEVMRLLAAVYSQKEEHGKAVTLLAACRAREPHNPYVLSTYSAVMHDMGEAEAAIELAELALKILPGFDDAIFNLRLAKGHLACKHGQRHFLARLRNRLVLRRDIPKPFWNGEWMGKDNQLLIWWEDGFGDNINFAPLIKVAKEMSGARIVFECNRFQYPVLKDLGELGWCDEVICGDGPGECDAQIPIISILSRTGLTITDLPIAEGYVRARPENVAKMLEAIPDGRGTVVGINWHGNPNCIAEPFREVPRDLLIDSVRSALKARMEDHTIVSLQYNETPLPIEDFADTAAAIEICDLVISTDTSVAHLAGAMGKDVWMLLPTDKIDWRWAGEGERCPWYPSMSVLRQTEHEQPLLEYLSERLLTHRF